VASFASIAALFLGALFATGAAAAPPQVNLTTFSSVGSGSATLEADINPGGKETIYHFEYGFASCASSPCAGTPLTVIEAGSEPVRVKATVNGLDPATTYHFRVVAKNGATANGLDTSFTTYPQASVFGPCANDAFRSEPQPSGALPDCRAYEQASPVTKNALDARGRVNLVKASPDGDRISFVTAGGIPGAEGAQDLPTYLSSRVGASWSTQGLLPPADIGEEAFVLGWTPNFSEVFDFVRKFNGSGGGVFLMRSGSSVERIVDYGEGLKSNEPPRYAGASADGSEVLFESSAKLTAVPEALEGKPNLYLWDRGSDRISLVGVLNDKTAPPAGAFAGPYDWFGGFRNNGGASANYYTQDEHVISADGSSVYFTAAGSGHLYLRRNPGQEQSPLNGKGECEKPATLACTTQVSTSQKTNGKGPGGTDSAGSQPAALAEATADGSTALFTSSEKLTNDANTGPELLPPTIGRANVGDGSQKKLEFITAHASGMAVDGSHIYWANPSAGAIGRAQLNGEGDATNVEEEFITDTSAKATIEGQEVTLPGKPQYVAVNGEHIYWTNSADGGKEHGTIGRAELGGGKPEPEFISGATNPEGIAVAAEYVYWANGGKETATRTIGRAKQADGKEVEQAFIAVDDSSIEFTPQGLAVDATHIYMTINGAQKSNYVFRYDLDGKNRLLWFDDFGIEARGIALDGGHVYWGRQAKETIGRAKLDLSEPEKEFIKEAGHPLGVAVDGGHIYWSANQESPGNPGNDLYQYTTTGGLKDLTPLAGGNGAQVVGVLGSSADGSAVYLAANGDLDGGGPGKAGDCTASAGSNLQSSGECDLYLVRDGSPASFIARLDAEAGGSDAFDWLPHGGVSQEQKTARVSSDGQTLLFRSKGRLTAYNNEGTPEFYRYRAGGEIVCISCDPTGAVPTGTPSLGSINLSTDFPTEWGYQLSRNLSTGGNRVFFETPDALVAADTNGAGGCPLVGNGKYWICLDVYEWEAAGSGSCPTNAPGGGCVYLLSSGKSADASYIADASASGDDVFLITRSPFVRQDQDQLYDVYDAHVEGGLASQNQVAHECEGEGCKGAGPAPPAFASPGSAGFVGPADPKPRHPHKKQGKRKGKKHQHKKHGHRAAKTSGRAGR
jgi:hypothetical protein